MSKHYYDRREKLFIAAAVLVIIALLVWIAARPINKVINIRKIEGTVTGTTVKRIGKKDTYLVFITDESGENVSLEVTDSLFRWRFNSSDVYAGIEDGKKYSFEVGGLRIPILSWYPNIYSYEEIE